MEAVSLPGLPSLESLPSLVGLLSFEIETVLKENSFAKLPAFRINQIYRWACSGISSFEEMENLPKDMRKSLSEKFCVFSSSKGTVLKDKDKTVKLQIKLEDGKFIEAVILRDGKDRLTACLSAQAGCASGCVFCKTAQMGFSRNLHYKEIAEEFLLLQNEAKSGTGTPVTHIVFMGMGEPLLNFRNIGKAVDYFHDEKGLNISLRRITLSTCGIIEGINNFAENGPDIRLAVSLASAKEDLRKRLMPVAESNPLGGLQESLFNYQKKHRKRITLEMPLFKGLNTGEDEAAAVAKFARGLDAVINIIPWNPVENAKAQGIALETPDRQETAFFADELEKRGLKVTRRFEKGRLISGACGQLGA